jgi:hypothetical protein
LKIVTETSTLVSASIFWQAKVRKKELALYHHFFYKCCALLEFCKTNNMSENVIITKTVEEEARNALDRAVENTIRD